MFFKTGIKIGRADLWVNANGGRWNRIQQAEIRGDEFLKPC